MAVAAENFGHFAAIQRPGSGVYYMCTLKKKGGAENMQDNKFIALDVDDMIFGRDDREISQR